MCAWLANQKEVFCKKERLIGWICPIEDWVKINTDGAFKGNLGLKNRERVIKDLAGSWITKFAMNLGYYSSVVAEVWALFHTL